MAIDKKVYPPNWEQIRQRIMARAGYRCEQCDVARYTVYYLEGKTRRPLIVAATYKEGLELRDRMAPVIGKKLKVIRLTTAHKNHDEWNHAVEDKDLACYCERCHLNYDREDNERRKHYGKHYKRRQIELFNDQTSVI